MKNKQDGIHWDIQDLINNSDSYEGLKNLPDGIYGSCLLLGTTIYLDVFTKKHTKKVRDFLESAGYIQKTFYSKGDKDD